MSEDRRFFFRNEKLGNEPETFIDVPEDLAWAVEQGLERPTQRSGSGKGGGQAYGPGSGSGSGEGSGYDASYPFPNTKIDTPVIRGIVRQEVSQDPEGKGTIDVTFGVDDLTQGSVEWEIRVTR